MGGAGGKGAVEIGAQPTQPHLRLPAGKIEVDGPANQVGQIADSRLEVGRVKAAQWAASPALHGAALQAKSHLGLGGQRDEDLVQRARSCEDLLKALLSPVFE